MLSGIPDQAVGLSIFVILYSAVCFCLSALLFALLWRSGSRWNYVAYVAIFFSVSTAVSIVQQIHYAANFKNIKAAQAAAKTDLQSQPVIVVAGSSQGLDLVLFWIQYYIYNVNALLILFWSIQLFKNTWRMTSKSTWLTDSAIESFCKAFSIIFPGLLFGIIQIDPISRSFVPFLFCCNIILFVSVVGGSVCLILTLYKFIEARRKVNGSSGSYGNSNSGTISTANENRHLSIKRASDRWLIIRFTIAFVILSVFEVCQILFEVVAYNRNKDAVISNIDLSSAGAITDIVQFIPGATTSLVSYLIWGTTSRFRKETLALLCCGTRTSRSTPSHAHGNSVVAKLRNGAAHTRQSSDRTFERLEEGGESDDQGQLKGGDIHVTTELSVLSQDALSGTRPAHVMDGSAWPIAEPSSLDAPVRSVSALGLKRSESSSRAR